MVEWLLTGTPPPSEQRYWQNRETANIGLQLAQLVERRHVNPEVSGTNPALVNFSLFIQNVSFTSLLTTKQYSYFLKNCIKYIPIYLTNRFEKSIVSVSERQDSSWWEPSNTLIAILSQHASPMVFFGHRNKKTHTEFQFLFLNSW